MLKPTKYFYVLLSVLLLASISSSFAAGEGGSTSGGSDQEDVLDCIQPVVSNPFYNSSDIENALRACGFKDSDIIRIMKNFSE